MLGLSAGMESTVQHIRSKDFPQEDSHPPSRCCYFFFLFLLHHLFEPHIPSNMQTPCTPPSLYSSCLDTACRGLGGTSVTGINMPVRWLLMFERALEGRQISQSF